MANYDTCNKMGQWHIIIKIFCAIFYPFLGISLLALTVYTVYDMLIDELISFKFLFFGSLLLCITFLFFYYGWILFLLLFVKYRFDNEGLTVKYPVHQPQLISWDAFQEVCVCYADYPTHGEPEKHIVICCVKKGEKQSLLQGRWKTDNLFRYRSVITMVYTPSLLKKLAEKCPYKVQDNRHISQLY